MPKIRTIKPEFWEDEKIASLPRECRLLFIGLLNFCDDGGVIKSNPLFIKSRVFPLDNDVTKSTVDNWMGKLEALKLVSRIIYKGEGFYHITKFSLHQLVDKRWAKYSIPLEELKALTELNHSVSQEVTARPQGGHAAVLDMERKGKEVDMEGDVGGGAVAPPPPPDSDESLFKALQEWIQKNAPLVSKMKEPIRLDQYKRLREDYSRDLVQKILQEMHNWKPLCKKNTSAYLTIRSWADKRIQDTKQTLKTNEQSYREQEGKALLEQAGI
jgi:hypothetical protein